MSLLLIIYNLLKEYVKIECGDKTQTAVSTHSNQIEIFTNKMKTGDFVITPASSSGDYSVGLIIGDYHYDHNVFPFHHSRRVDWLEHNISRSLFSEKMQHTLGAYRTIFALKDDVEFIKFMERLMKKERIHAGK